MSTELSSSQLAWRQVLTARNEFFQFQDALLEITSPSRVEGLELDKERRLAVRLVERLGKHDAAQSRCSEIYDCCRELMNHSRALNKENPELSSAEHNELLDADFKELTRLLHDTGISDELMTQCLHEYIRLTRRVHPRDALMLESMLISGVSSFESFISRLITASLRFDPTPLGKSERSYEYKEIIGFEKMTDFIEDAADKFVDNLMRDPLEKWLDFLSTALRLKDIAWIKSELNEPLQRRHIHVHNGGRVSRAYLEKVKDPGNKVILQTRLPVTLDYLTDVLNRLAKVVYFLSQAALFAIQSSTKSKSENFADHDLSGYDIAFECLLDGRFQVISDLFGILEPFFWKANAREYFRANCWQAKKSLGQIDSIRADIEAWDVSLNEMLEIAKLCLLEDIDGAKKLLEKLVDEKKLSSIELATWPILEPLRRFDQAAAEFVE